MPRTKSALSGPFETFELTLSEVYLLTRDEQGEVAVPGLGVVVDQLGLTVLKPDGSVGAVLKWGTLKSLKAPGRTEMPPGTTAVIIEAVSTIRPHRFLVPTDDPEGLEAVVAELSNYADSRLGDRHRRGGLRRLLGRA